MIETCPHCRMGLRFSQAHKDKLTTALDRLPRGKSLKFNCPGCKTPIELDKSGNPPAREIAGAQPSGKGSGGPPVSPPSAPDLSWLTTGDTGEEAIQDDVPTAMILVDDPAVADQAAEGLTDYQVFVPENPEDAMEEMRFRDFEVVVFFSGYGGGRLRSQAFHRFMMKMSMKKRRKIFYVLIGPEFHTLYDLQALTASANLVVNPAQMDHFPALVKKGVRTYEDLFGPYLSALKHHGKD